MHRMVVRAASFLLFLKAREGGWKEQEREACAPGACRQEALGEGLLKEEGMEQKKRANCKSFCHNRSIPVFPCSFFHLFRVHLLIHM